MFLIAVAGGSGSGKTTFTKKVLTGVASRDVVCLHQDSYYLPKIAPPANFDHPNAFDWDLLKKHLRTLKSGQKIDTPTYDFTISGRMPGTIPMGPAKVCIFDGIFALWDEEIRNMTDLKIFLQVDADIRFIRRLHRDVKERGRSLDGIITQYYDTVRPMHKQFLDPTSQFADLIVGEETDVPAEVIASKIRTVLA